MSKVVVARPIDGITLNSELEFLLDNSGEIKVFDSEDHAHDFLAAAGIGLEELRHMVFMEKDGRLVCLPLEVD